MRAAVPRDSAHVQSASADSAVRDKLEPEQQQLLLRSVVQVTFEMTPSLVCSLDDATARLLQLREMRLCLGMQPLVLRRDRDRRIHRSFDER